MSDNNETPELTPEEEAAAAKAAAEAVEWVEGEAETKEPSGAVDLSQKQEHIDVTCVGCNSTFGFDIDSKTEGFTFICTVCKTQTAWTRA